jgi:hypothetical protein
VGRKAFVVDSGILDPDCLAVGEFDGEERYERFDPSSFRRYNRIGETTLVHYREAAAADRWPFVYAGITHVFYRGRIPIAGLPVIPVRH